MIHKSTSESGVEDQIEICHLMGSVGMGGRESLLLDIIKNSGNHFNHTVIGFRYNAETLSKFEEIGVTVIGLDFSSRADLVEYFRLVRTIRELSPDIIHAHGPNGQLPARLIGACLGIRIISTHHGVTEMFPDWLLKAERWTRFLDSASVAVSNGVRESYSSCPIGESWWTIHNGIDVREFNRAVTESDAETIRADYNIGDDDTVFLNVGRYVDEKRQEDLIDAMASITETHQTARLFIVGGRGGGPEGLRERVSELEIEANVFVTGRVEEIHPYYAAADIFALASTHEGLPITLLEAMVAKQAIVATDIPGVREVITDGETGLLVTPRKPAELATAMIRLIDKELRQRLAQAGYERVVSEFSIEATTRSYEKLYREVTS